MRIGSLCALTLFAAALFIACFATNPNRIIWMTSRSREQVIRHQLCATNFLL